MANCAILGTAYCLNHVPNLAYHYGNTPWVEREGSGETDFLRDLKGAMRDHAFACSYAPNQAYVGAMDLCGLEGHPKPWYDNPVREANRFGRYGEIMPEDEFIGLMDICDVFDLILLEAGFAAEVRGKLSSHPLMKDHLLNRLETGHPLEEIQGELTKGALPLYLGDRLVGCCRKGHEIDECLSAYVLLENIACKAGGVLALLHLLNNTGLSPEEVDFVVECSEEACGDMNQRGGGNFAKAVAEICGCVNASGCDVRGFCAGPVNAMIVGGSMVAASARRNVVVLAGGAVPKLYMNSRDHLKKGVPPLEDCLGNFAILLGPEDGRNPVMRLDALGKHSVGAGASPQAVTTALVYEPLAKLGLGFLDVDKYAAELHIPEITLPAGAGDPANANFKMIAALAAMKGQIEKAKMNDFVVERGIPGFAHTQGHIPSGVPFVGPARDWILEGRIKRAMIIGKGSLFLARMTNLSDGASFVIEPPSPVSHGVSVTKEEVKAFILEALEEALASLRKS
ncbi:glycine/sarcosine/betaine reductase complex component C subunit beta [Thermanaerovibrio acidaminovorans]|jgi:betaine reductase|uniref:Betaine reductase n=1 Tax=Thermanaerovibrio acidaminovorans (strain ATCC 49978 / DSM 6589 / Su883) TaxID=525903 RepID=D1B5S6_THEAS|nr:glycine/sarcosine/betaine reductase complex component C subunit beta [Thermanaerovibrio acidaminovorans]ACZ19367.1 betaine reductase [Thermanaerovibrio acidaminovorans DSM 6589]